MLTRLRRWWFPMAAALLLIVLAGADTWLKSTPDPGYCPEHAFVIAAADDLPAFYAAFGKCDFAAAASKEIKAPLADFARWVRITTGIRPTPLRCRVWLGDKLLAADSEEGAGLCIHPGLLLRVAGLYHRFTHRAVGEDGVRRAGNVFYAWRDGFLIVSPSQAYVSASLAAAPPKLEPSEGRDEMRFAVPGSGGAVRIRARDGLPITGHFKAALTHRTKPLTLAEVWPEPPLLAIAVSRWSELTAARRAVFEMIQSAAEGLLSEDARTNALGFIMALDQYLVEQFKFNNVPKDWDASINECAAALWNIDASEVTPVPELAVILRGENPVSGKHPFEDAFPVENTVPHEWEGRAGKVVPWLGEKLAICLVGRDRDWLLTTQEPLLAQWLAYRGPETSINADAALAFDWSKAARCAEALLLHAADLEFLPRMNRKDVENDWMPYVHAAGHLGTLHVQAVSREGRIEFNGFLARQLGEQ